MIRSDKLKIISLIIFLLCFILKCKDSYRTEVKTENPNPGNNLSFKDVTQLAKLNEFRHINGAKGDKWFPEPMGPGIAVIDYNNDQWPDIVIVKGANWINNNVPALALYKNNGDKTFSDVSVPGGVDKLRGIGMGLAVGDYNNDGFDDIFLTNLGGNILLRNENGVFKDVTNLSGLNEFEEWSTSAMWIDTDRDGLLDLFIGNYVYWSPEMDIYCSINGKTKSYCTPEPYKGTPSRFYHNNGDGTFTDWTKKSGFSNSPGKTLGVTSFDFNRDSWPDILLANDTQRDEFYINNGDGSYTEKGAASGMAYDQNGKARAGMGIDAGVVDTTDQETIFTGNFSKEMIGVYRHTSNGFFTDRAASSKIGKASLLTLTFGLFLFDADLDGDLDLFAANGHITDDVEAVQDGITYKQPSHLFINNGNGYFTDEADKSGDINAPIVGRGAVRIDYDRDGDFDILITENNSGVRLWENNAVQLGKNYLAVKLTGSHSNRNAYGSAIRMISGKQKCYQYFKAGSSYLSQSENLTIFGLADHKTIDSLIVKWPSGTTNLLTNLKSDTLIEITED